MKVHEDKPGLGRRVPGLQSGAAMEIEFSRKSVYL
jgi:hypothetical protein